MNPFVFFVSAFLIIAFVAVGVAFPQEMRIAFENIQDWISTNLGWYYIYCVGFFLIFIIWLYFSRYSEIRLGPDDSRPDYTYRSWFAMLFSAGMGIGLIFYSVAEPMIHFLEPPLSTPGTIQAARRAMQLTYFHWGLHAWAIYIVLGLALAYYSHRHGLPLSLRSALFPILGEKVNGIWGDIADTFAVLGTLFGIATSLGLGVLQVNAGMEYLGIWSVSPAHQLILIAVITSLATASVVSGLDRGILWLSNANIFIGAILMIFVFSVGPSLFILKSLFQNTADYVQDIISLTYWNAAYRNSDWQKNWTLFYWAWWMAWSPFVGMFIARISRGRTIKEFIIGVLLVPTGFTFIWLTIFGNTAIYMELFGNGAEAIENAVVHSELIPTALYMMLDKLPLSAVTSFLATIVVASYFVTSADSGSLVIDIITAGGHQDPPLRQRIFWALSQGCVAAVLLLAGGLLALQTAVLTTALPLSLILLLLCHGLAKTLRHDYEDSLRIPKSVQVQNPEE